MVEAHAKPAPEFKSEDSGVWVQMITIPYHRMHNANLQAFSIRRPSSFVSGQLSAKLVGLNTIQPVRFRTRREQLKRVSQIFARKQRPKAGLYCLLCSEST